MDFPWPIPIVLLFPIIKLGIGLELRVVVTWHINKGQEPEQAVLLIDQLQRTCPHFVVSGDELRFLFREENGWHICNHCGAIAEKSAWVIITRPMYKDRVKRIRKLHKKLGYPTDMF